MKAFIMDYTKSTSITKGLNTLRLMQIPGVIPTTTEMKKKRLCKRLQCMFLICVCICRMIEGKGRQHNIMAVG